MKLLAVAIVSVSILIAFTAAEMLPVDCSAAAGVPSTFSRTFDNVSSDAVATLAVFRGTAFYVDCFAFSVLNDACDGSMGRNGAVVQAWASVSASVDGPEIARHPLSGELGMSVLTSAYYYDGDRYVSLRMSIASRPAGCGSVSVAYTYSAFSSAVQPPQYQGGQAGSAPQLVSASPRVSTAGAPTTLYFTVGSTHSEPSTFTFGLSSTSAACRNTQPTGSVSMVTQPNGTRLISWTFSTSTSAGSMSKVFVVCMGAGNAAPSAYITSINVYSNNPAFGVVNGDQGRIVSPNLPIGTPLAIDFYGTGLDLRKNKDNARLVSVMQSCTSSPQAPCVDGIPPSPLAPQGVQQANVATLNATLVAGAFRVCYQRTYPSTQVVDVPRYYPVLVISRNLVSNVSGPIIVTDAPTAAPTAAPTTAAPTSLTSAPSAPSSTVAETDVCIASTLPASCTLLSNDNCNLLLLVNVEFTVALFDVLSWREAMADLLCIAVENVAIFEMVDDASVSGRATIVLGLLNQCSTAGTLLSSLQCIAAGNAPDTPEVHAFRAKLASDELRVLSLSAATSDLRTANTTSNAYPSSALSKQAVIYVAAGAAAGAVLLIVATIIAVDQYRRYRNRRNNLVQVLPTTNSLVVVGILLPTKPTTKLTSMDTEPTEGEVVPFAWNEEFSEKVVDA